MSHQQRQDVARAALGEEARQVRERYAKLQIQLEMIQSEKEVEIEAPTPQRMHPYSSGGG